MLAQGRSSSQKKKKIELGLKYHLRGWPRGLAVKGACSATGDLGSDPKRAPTHRLSGHAVVASHIKWRKIGTDVSSGPVFLSKKRRIGRC